MIGFAGAIVSTVTLPVIVDPDAPRLSYPVTRNTFAPSLSSRIGRREYPVDVFAPLAIRVHPTVRTSTRTAPLPPLHE